MVDGGTVILNHDRGYTPRLIDKTLGIDSIKLRQEIRLNNLSFLGESYMSPSWKSFMKRSMADVEIELNIPLSKLLRPGDHWPPHRIRRKRNFTKKQIQKKWNDKNKQKLTMIYKRSRILRKLMVSSSVYPIGSKEWLDVLQAFEDLKSLEHALKGLPNARRS